MNIVVAVYADWGIGKRGTQPVVIKDDRRHFRQVTGSGTVIVGRKTLADFPGGRPLKGRRNIVMSGNKELVIEGAEVVGDVKAVLDAVSDDEQVFVIGGESVYRQLLEYCTYAYVTKIELIPESDKFFPNLDELSNWELDEDEDYREEDGIKFKYVRYKNNDVKRI